MKDAGDREVIETGDNPISEKGQRRSATAMETGDSLSETDYRQSARETDEDDSTVC
jgi:hypothetical protein